MHQFLLETKSVTKSFGGLMATNNVSMKVVRGTIHAIIGPNGAGKTTLFNLVSGLIQPDEGMIEYKGEDITGSAPAEICRKGLLRSFQVAAIYPLMSVLENVKVVIFSRENRIFSFFNSAKKIFNEEAREILDWVGLSDQEDMDAGNLSHGDRKSLELAIVLANKPELLLLDEPTAGMSKDETQQAMKLVERIASEKDLTILFTEHDMGVVFGISQWISVLNMGKILTEGTPTEVRENEEVKKVYLGEK